jgi:hypothetical protein
MSNGWTYDDFGPNASQEALVYLDGRLTLWGHPPAYGKSFWKRVQDWQLARGYKGTEPGQAADGYLGPTQMRQLKSDPPRPPQPRGEVPSDILDFSRWKLTRPDGKEIMPDKLVAGYEDIECFFANAEGDGVVFLVDIDGKLNATTPHTTYSRSECRELELDGSKAAWDSETGLFIMRGQLRITELPDGKPSLVFGQAHDDLDDIIMAQCYGSELFISESKGKDKGSIKHPLITNYKKGSLIDYELSFSPMGINAMINGKKIDTIKKVVDDAYWKFGCYSQANKSNGSGHAEVVYTGLEIERR